MFRNVEKLIEISSYFYVLDVDKLSFLQFSNLLIRMKFCYIMHIAECTYLFNTAKKSVSGQNELRGFDAKPSKYSILLEIQC